MIRSSSEILSAIEVEAVNLIRRSRACSGELANRDAQMRADTVYKILVSYNGNVNLRLSVIASAMACTMRTLEREFLARFSETMHSVQERTRLAHAEALLTHHPHLKLMTIAAELGYKRESELHRFFRRQKGISPREFSKRRIGTRE
jgi:AraC-like DNA-binding protein